MGRIFVGCAQKVSGARSGRAPLTPSAVEAAAAAMREMAHRSAAAQRLPIVDYLVAAAAQELGAAESTATATTTPWAELMEFESVWLAPLGTLP